MQRLVYDETESHERAEEASPSVREERLLTHFIKHLVRITLKRNSFYVTLGVSRLLYHYATPEAVEIYGLVMQNPSRVKDNYYWRARKSRLLQEVKTRFGDLIALSRGAYGEERFAASDDSPRYSGFVKECLKMLVPWGTACPLPPGVEAVAGSIPPLDFRGPDPDEEHLVEIARIHAVLHSDCFARLVAGLKLDAPDARLALPRFFLSRNHDQNKPMQSHGLQSGEMNQPNLNAMRARLSEQEQLLRRAKPQQLSLVVDGRQRATLDLVAGGQARFTLAEGEEFIELRTLPEEGDLRLALYPIDYARLERTTDADQFVLALADGRKLNFAIAPQRDEQGELLGATVSASFQSPAWQRWRQSLGAFFAPPAVSYAFGAALLIAGLSLGVMLWKSLRSDSATTNVAVNKPPVAGGSNGGATVPPASPKPEASTPGSSAEKPPRPQSGNPGAAPGGVKRDSDLAPVVKTLAEVKQIFIALDGESPPARALREQLSRQLQASGRWTLAPREEADTALNVVLRSGGHTATLQLVNASGRIIWPSKGKWRTYSGDAEQIADQVMNELLKAAR